MEKLNYTRYCVTSLPEGALQLDRYAGPIKFDTDLPSISEVMLHGTDPRKRDKVSLANIRLSVRRSPFSELITHIIFLEYCTETQ